MRCDVRLYGIARVKAGLASTEVTVPEGATGDDLIRALTERLGDDFTRQVLSRDGFLLDYIRILINDELLPPGRLKEPLKTTDAGTNCIGVYVLPAEIGG